MRWNVVSLVAVAALAASIDASTTLIHAATLNRNGRFGMRAGAA